MLPLPDVPEASSCNQMNFLYRSKQDLPLIVNRQRHVAVVTGRC
jgi:hypothetical protein